MGAACGFANLPSRQPPSRKPGGYDVAVLDDVRLPFQSVDAVRLRLLHGADALEVLVGDDLSTHESPGEVGVDFTRAFHGVGAAADVPGPTLVGADGEEDDPAHRR